MTVGFVCSSGGHLTQLYWLKPWWEHHDRFWVTFDTDDARNLLVGERVYWAFHPTNRSLGNLLRNTRIAGRILGREEPEVLVSNGAGVAVPFFFWGKLLDIPLIFIEVYDRIDTASVTGQLVAPLADRVILQWEQQREHYPEGTFLGTIR